MSEEDINFLISIQDLEQSEFDNACLERENKKIKETNIYCNRTDCSGRIKDSRKYDSVYQEKEDYKSRCEKASEYIKENPARCWYDAKKKSEKFGDIEIINHQKILLDILQGSDK